jgi:hypothetical protein
MERAASMSPEFHLRTYDSADQDHSGRDFLAETTLPPGVQAIVTHPPYRHAAEFVRKALELGAEKVQEIRRSTASSSTLAERFGVSTGTISKARLRQTWKHVGEITNECALEEVLADETIPEALRPPALGPAPETNL